MKVQNISILHVNMENQIGPFSQIWTFFKKMDFFKKYDFLK